MKDIKQYFTNGTNIIDKEAVIDSGNVMEQEEQEQKDTIVTSKRKRVKIRISRNSISRTCDIIENKSDLIDKTPSPFNSEINNDQRTLRNGTPKSSLTESGIKQRLKKVSLILIRVTQLISVN